MTPRRCLPVVLLLLLSACDFVAPDAATEPIPVLEGILVAGRDSQYIQIRLARSADSAFVPYGPGARARTVSFTTTGNGSTVPAVAYRTDWILIPFRIHPDSTYSIQGTVDGIPVSATTTVPHAVVVDDPAGDTLVIDTLGACAPGFCTFPVAVHGEGAFGYSLEFRDASDVLRLRGRIDNGVSTLDLDLFTLRSSTTADFFGLDEAAASFLLQTEPRSNIVGGFGVFGSAVLERKVVRLE